MKLNLIGSSLVALFLLTCSLFAQDTLNILYYPSGRNFSESIRCVVDEGETFRYRYEIENSPNSAQRIWSFLICTDAQVDSIVAPEGWRSSLTLGVQNTRRVEWWASDTADFIQPGSTLRNLSVSSPHIPSILSYYAEGWFDLPKVSVEPDSIVGDGDIFERYKRGSAIGPKLPLFPFEALQFLDTLISYKHQAFALGWIKEEGIVTSLDAKLEAARVQMINDRPSAKQILQAFVSELEALNTQSNKITSEAYALLKFNAQYLISNL
jgi:hypothetical protein